MALAAFGPGAQMRLVCAMDMYICAARGFCKSCVVKVASSAGALGQGKFYSCFKLALGFTAIFLQVLPLLTKKMKLRVLKIFMCACRAPLIFDSGRLAKYPCKKRGV